MPPLRCAPYYRVSRKDSERGISIEIQRDTCEPYATSRGWQLLPAYIDDGRSAFTDKLDKRPAFQQLMADARLKRFDVVLVYLYDRFARKMRLMLQCIEDLERCGVQVVSATQPGDWLSVGMNALIAEQYSRMLSARMKDVRRWEAQQGRHVGPVPVGYERRDGVLFPSAQAEAVRYAGQLYATGLYSAHAVTLALRAAGHTMPDGMPFVTTGVEELLKNPVYAGFVQCGELLLPGKHEAVWDETTWARIQEVQQQRSYRRRIKPAIRHDPILAGVITCASCGAPMWHHSGRLARYYQCRSVTGRPGPIADLVCTGDQARAEAVEQTTLAWVAGLGLTPALLETVQQLAHQPRRTAAPDRGEVETRLKRLARAYADGAYSDAEYATRRRVLLALLEEAPPAAVVDSGPLLALVEDLPTLLVEAPNAERRALLNEFLSQVYARRSEVLAVRPTRMALPLFQAAALHPDEWVKGALLWAGWVSDTDTRLLVGPRQCAA